MKDCTNESMKRIMLSYTLFIILLIASITAGCSINNVGKNSNSINTKDRNVVLDYPISSYKILSSTGKQQKIQLFKAKNGDLCSVRTVDPSIIDYREFDQLGFIEGISCLLLDSNYPQSDWNFTKTDIDNVNQFISQNSDFFGIDNIDSFNLYPSTDGNLYYISEQNISGHSLDNLINFQRAFQLIVSKTGKYVSFSGHFYPNATLPTNPRFSEQEITNLFVGKTYSYPEYPCIDDFKGTCHPKSITIKLAPNNLEIKLVAFLYNGNQSSVELRLVYTVHIKAPYLEKGTYHEDTKIIDAITGEELKLN